MNNVISAISDTAREFRSVLRGLGHKPGYAIAAWVMLGLAIAANAAVFAIVYGFMLKPLPYMQPAQLSVVRERYVKIGLDTPLMSVKTYLELKQGLSDTANAGLSTNGGGGIATIAGRPHLLTAQNVTPSLFDTLGVAPILGRLLVAAAGQPGGPPEAVISWRFWQSAYDGSVNVLNQSFEIEGKTYRIVGVMPRDFFIQQGGFDAWLPFVMTPEQRENGNINYWMMVRRKPGVSEHGLNLALANMQQRIVDLQSPQNRAGAIRDGYLLDARSPHAIALEDYSDVGHLPWLLQAAAGLLLLLALANTINLGLVRQRARQQQFAMRQALGASRTGLVRLILLEHLPIAAVIGVTAMLLSWAGINTLHAFGLPSLYSPFRVEVGPAVIIFTWILAVMAVLVVVFGQALLATGGRVLEAIRGGHTVGGGRGARQLQRSLGVVQIALACTLIIAGGLLGVSLYKVLSQPIGFSPEQRIVASVVLPDNMKSSASAWSQLEPALSKIPGVEHAAVTDMPPFSGNFDMGIVNTLDSRHAIHSKLPLVSAQYFATMNIPFVAGQGFSPTDIASQAPVIVINDFLAKQFFGSADQAIGKTLVILGKRRVIGVTKTILWAPTPDQYEPGTAFLPFGTFENGFKVIVESSAPLAITRQELERTIADTLPGSIVATIRPYPQLVQGAAVFRAAGAGMVGAFAVLALLLAALGAFAITAFIARARLGEYGIRSALGAGPLALLRLGFREAAWLLIIGVPIGLIGAWLLGRALASTLYQTPVLEWWLYIIGALLMVAVVLAAAWGPARRAARVPVRELLSGDTQ